MRQIQQSIDIKKNSWNTKIFSEVDHLIEYFFVFVAQKGQNLFYHGIICNFFFQKFSDGFLSCLFKYTKINLADGGYVALYDFFNCNGFIVLEHKFYVNLEESNGW